MRISLLLISLLFLVSGPGAAIDPGVARGTLQIRGETIELKYAYAAEHDNAESLLDGPELRVLLADREVSDSLLAGYDGRARAERLAREGKLRGVLLRFGLRLIAEDQMEGTLLTATANPSESMLFFSSAPVQVWPSSAPSSWSTRAAGKRS